jgi:hypothetical protein
MKSLHNKLAMIVRFGNEMSNRINVEKSSYTHKQK